MIENRKKLQEDEYEFPYHYLPTRDNLTYRHFKALNWGHEYLAYLEFLNNLLKMVPFQSLCDVGCGSLS